MTNHKNTADSLEHFFTALAESEFSTEDEQAIADQEDSDRAERLRTLMLDSIKRVKLERRAKAEQTHRNSLEQLQDSKLLLPSTADQRRLLLERTLRQRPDVREMTLQHREFKELSDDDVERLLTKMHHLGALNEDDNGGDGGAST